MVQNYCTGLCTLDLTATLNMADTHNTQQILRLGGDLYDALGMYLIGRLGSIREVCRMI